VLKYIITTTWYYYYILAIAIKTHINMTIFRQRNDEIWQVILLSVITIQIGHLSHARKVQDF